MKVVKPNTLSSTDGTFTRSSIATYFTAAKVLTTAANDVPRFNYNPITGDFDGILLEAAATNILLYSEQFDNAAWGKIGATVTANSSTAPTNTAIADTANNAAGATSLLYQNVTISASSTNDYYFSVFVKKGTAAKITLNAYYSGSAEDNVTFDLDAQTVTGTPYAGEYIIQNVGNGFYRCGYRLTRDATGTRTLIEARLWIGGRGAGVVGSTNILFGAQLELGSKPTSYIPTTTAAVTRSADTVTGSGLIYTSVTDPNPVYNAATAYLVGVRVRYNYRIYESLQGSNTGHTPSTSPTWWLDVGPDNMHAAFDTQISTVSTATTKMTFVVKVGTVDSVALINMSAVTARVTVYDQTAGTYSRYLAGLTGLEVYDWYQYFFFDPLIKRTQVVITDIPTTTNAYITIELEGNPGDTVSLAQAIFGLVEDLGGTQYGATAGIIDYSIKSTDDFGTVTFVKRNYSKRLSAQVFVDNSKINRVQRLLYDIRATPVVWVGTETPELEEASVVYGFYKEFSTAIEYPSFSLCSLEIEGLT